VPNFGYSLKLGKVGKALPQQIAVSKDQEARVRMPGTRDIGTLNDSVGSVIATHAVKCDGQVVRQNGSPSLISAY
jgi:hypothetical protein